MIDKVKVLTLSGNFISLEEWQLRYGLPIGSPQIGKYFSINEREFAENIRVQGQLIVTEPLIMVMDKTRELHGNTLRVNSFNRSEEEQIALKNSYKRAATVSPHVAKMAVDLDTDTIEETKNLVVKIKEAANLLNIKVRIGWKDYMNDGKTFVHIDVCPEYFSKGRPFHDQVEADPRKKPWMYTLEW